MIDPVKLGDTPPRLQDCAYVSGGDRTDPRVFHGIFALHDNFSALFRKLGQRASLFILNFGEAFVHGIMHDVQKYVILGGGAFELDSLFPNLLILRSVSLKTSNELVAFVPI